MYNHPQNYELRPCGIKKEKSLKKILYKLGQKIEPWCTPDMIVSNPL